MTFLQNFVSQQRNFTDQTQDKETDLIIEKELAEKQLGDKASFILHGLNMSAYRDSSTQRLFRLEEKDIDPNLRKDILSNRLCLKNLVKIADFNFQHQILIPIPYFLAYQIWFIVQLGNWQQQEPISYQFCIILYIQGYIRQMMMVLGHCHTIRAALETSFIVLISLSMGVVQVIVDETFTEEDCKLAQIMIIALGTLYFNFYFCVASPLLMMLTEQTLNDILMQYEDMQYFDYVKTWFKKCLINYIKVVLNFTDYYTNLLISGIEFKRKNWVGFSCMFLSCFPKLPQGTYKLTPWKMINPEFKIQMLLLNFLGEIVSLTYIILQWDWETQTSLHLQSVFSGVMDMFMTTLNQVEEKLHDKMDHDIEQAQDNLNAFNQHYQKLQALFDMESAFTKLEKNSQQFISDSKQMRSKNLTDFKVHNIMEHSNRFSLRQSNIAASLKYVTSNQDSQNSDLSDIGQGSRNFGGFNTKGKDSKGNEIKMTAMEMKNSNNIELNDENSEADSDSVMDQESNPRVIDVDSNPHENKAQNCVIDEEEEHEPENASDYNYIFDPSLGLFSMMKPQSSSQITEEKAQVKLINDNSASNSNMPTNYKDDQEQDSVGTKVHNYEVDIEDVECIVDDKYDIKM